ncbi:MAG: hypothetical protein ACREP1_02915, partial [Rhodanobacteraceae bacterium]
VHTWTDITATTTYANKNLYLHNLTLDQNNKLEMVNVDASQVSQGKLGLQFQGTLGGGQVASKIDLSAAGKSYQTSTNVHAKDISLGKLGELIGKSPGQFSGDVKSADIDLKGSLDKPATWDGTINTDISNLREGGIALDHVKLEVHAAKGHATVREARIDQGNNHVQVHGSIELPATTAGFGQTPGNFQIAVDAPDLKQLTSFMAQPATGSLLANGNVKTGDGKVQLDLNANGNLIGFQGAAVKQLTANISATKEMPPPNEKPRKNAQAAPFYERLTSNLQLDLHDVRYGDYAIDEVRGTVKSDGAKVSLSPLTVTRNNNLLRVSGNFQLPPPNEKLINQPADLQLNLRAPQLADYWQSDAPNKLTGELQADGSVRIRGGIASGQINLYGQQIAAQKLVVKQLSMQTSIANDIVYLNDLTATLNEKDYINAHGTVKLQKPFHYTGAATVNLADLSMFAPLLSTAEKKMQLAGSLVLNWNGQGDAATLKNTGDLKLNLDHGRYADLQKLQANVEAHSSPEALNVPIVYLGSDKLSFQAILQAKDSTLEISKILIDQGKAKYATAYASLPFTWSNLGTSRPLFPPNGKVQINFESENLDIAKLFENVGAKPPAS